MAKGETYDEFVDKFKPKRTTDDCYTPPEIYEVVLNWAKKHLPIEGREIVRPFYPGGDYQAYNYPENCVVIDNPPFSIFTKICDWYNEHGISFLLFAPGLTSIRRGLTFIGLSTSVVFENGALVSTSFVTNMMGDILATSEPELCRELRRVVDMLRKKQKKELRKYSFPPNVLRASTLGVLSRWGVHYCVREGDGEIVAYAVTKKGAHFGNSILLSDKAAAEREAAEKAAAAENAAAAEKAAAHCLELSEESKQIIERLNQNN